MAKPECKQTWLYSNTVIGEILLKFHILWKYFFNAYYFFYIYYHLHCLLRMDLLGVLFGKVKYKISSCWKITGQESLEGYSQLPSWQMRLEGKIDPKFKNQLRFPAKTFAIIIMSSLIDWLLFLIYKLVFSPKTVMLIGLKFCLESQFSNHMSI